MFIGFQMFMQAGNSLHYFKQATWETWEKDTLFKSKEDNLSKLHLGFLIVGFIIWVSEGHMCGTMVGHSSASVSMSGQILVCDTPVSSGSSLLTENFQFVRGIMGPSMPRNHLLETFVSLIVFKAGKYQSETKGDGPVFSSFISGLFSMPTHPKGKKTFQSNLTVLLTTQILKPTVLDDTNPFSFE